MRVPSAPPRRARRRYFWHHVALMFGPPALAYVAIVASGSDATAKEMPAVESEQALAFDAPVVCDPDHPCMSLLPVEQDFVTACMAE
jgi:hypothetical protein